MKTRIDDFAKNYVVMKEKYLSSMFRSTLAAGFVMTVLYLLWKAYAPDAILPPVIHGAVGLILGVAIVFRINTSYDRWYEGRKLLDEIKASYRLLEGDGELKDRIRGALISWASDSGPAEDVLVAKSDWNRSHTANMYKAMCSCDRIAATPIPFALRMHIRLFIFAYIVTLPIGTMHTAGFLGILFSMVVYFIVAGFEVFSAEIEDPFKGDPNDFDIVKEIEEL